MKQLIQKLSADEVRKQFPIHDRLEGWFFRVRETSACAYLVEGTDLWGRTVARQGGDSDDLLRQCLEDAQAIIAQT